MKTCDERWWKEVLDHAASEPAGAKLAMHLSGCAVCSAALLELRQRMAEIDMGIHRLSSAEALPQAIPRALVAVRGQRRRAHLLDWRWAAAFVTAVAILVSVSGYLRVAREQERLALSAAAELDGWKSPTQGLLQSYNSSWLSTSPEVGAYFYRLDGANIGGYSRHPKSGTGRDLR